MSLHYLVKHEIVICRTSSSSSSSYLFAQNSRRK